MEQDGCLSSGSLDYCVCCSLILDGKGSPGSSPVPITGISGRPSYHCPNASQLCALTWLCSCFVKPQWAQCVMFDYPPDQTQQTWHTGNWRNNKRNSGLKSSTILQMDVVLFTWISYHALQIVHLLCVSPADRSAELRIKRWIMSLPEHSHENHK